MNGKATSSQARKRSIARSDLLPMDQYAKVRKERRGATRQVKQHRRVAVGPYASFYFECYETMLHQIHEMLFV